MKSESSRKWIAIVRRENRVVGKIYFPPQERESYGAPSFAYPGDSIDLALRIVSRIAQIRQFLKYQTNDLIRKIVDMAIVPVIR